MGMEHVVDFGTTAFPAWASAAALMAERGFHVDVRMVDGELTFPDELPPESWREMRLGTPGGMITLRRNANAVSVVTWENADPAMRDAWHAVTWAFAKAGNGRVMHPDGPLSADDFRRRQQP
jgi:hypothetical protein